MLLLATDIPVNAQTTSEQNPQSSFLATELGHIDISLLTCQPHDEVYSLYGHTAIRFRNTLTGRDLAVNYGVFDPSAGWFVLRFIFGLTDYSMGICSYQDFLREYEYFGSGVYEQHLNMSPDEKAAFVKALTENAQPQNVVYRYNYFYNNCTTRARDILLSSFGGDVQYKPLTHLQRGEETFRDLIHQKNVEHLWARLGNDLLLGCQADLNTTHDERQFLPDILACDFDSAHVVYHDGRTKPLVDTAYWAVAPGTPWHNPDTIDFPLTPLQCSWVVFCVILAIVLTECYFLCSGNQSPQRREKMAKRLPWIHYSIYCLYAIPGMILFLMLFSQHPTVKINFQLLMFCPLWFTLTLPKIFSKWGRWVVLACLAVFFLGNFVQSYAEGANVLALALLTTFCPYYFVNSKKSSNFAS